MKSKKMNYLPIIILPIVVLMCLGLWSAKSTPVELEYIDSKTAVYDMRNLDFTKTMARVTRTVEYVPNLLLTPEEFDKRDDIIVGQVPQDTDVATMRIRLLVPEDIQYGISGYSVNYASTVYINGKWIFNEGMPALLKNDEHSSESNRLFSAQPENGVIDILIQTSSFSNLDTSSGMSWYFGDYETLRVHFIRQITIDIIVIGWYIVASLISILLFMSQPSYKATLWLTLLAILWGLRTGLKNTKILLTLFPNLEWALVFRAEILTSPLTIILLTLILHSVFPGALPKWLRITIISAGVAGSLAIIFLPWENFLGHSGIMNQIIYMVLALLLLFILIKNRHTRPTLPQGIVLAGIIMSLISFIWDSEYFTKNQLPFALTQPILVAFSVFMLVSAVLDTMEKTVEQEMLLGKKVAIQEKELAESRISIMLSQIQPHFLYNSLTAVGELCDINPKKAKTAVIDFAYYLRGNLESLGDKKLVLFKTELDHVKAYLSMEQLRYGDRLKVEYEISEDNFILPSLTIQPIVENAVQHGVMKKINGGTVLIKTKVDDKGVRVIVSDDGIGFDPSLKKDDGRTHIGIENVRQRIEALCSGTLTINSVPGKGTDVVIIIPNNREVE